MSDAKHRAVFLPDDISERAGRAFDGLLDRYQQTGRPINFDFRLHCSAWTTRSDSFTHRIHRYPARLTPYIPLFFLSVPRIGVRGGRLLDPFAGCGTVLVEAPVHLCNPMHAVGLEINPLARVIARAKTSSVKSAAIKTSMRAVEARYHLDGRRSRLPNFPNKNMWFSELVERRLARVLRAIEQVTGDELYDFFLVSLSSVVRRVALADPEISVPVRLNPSRYKVPAIRKAIREKLKERETADVFELFRDAVRENTLRLAGWQAHRLDGCLAEVGGADARTFKEAIIGRGGRISQPPRQLGRKFDLILTSPPYANAQRYTRSLRLELFALGFASSASDEAELDRHQVGTERVSRDQWSTMIDAVDSKAALVAIKQIRKVDLYRAAIVSNYVANMKTVMKNCADALNSGGHAIFVIGNNTIRGIPLKNAAILKELAIAAGFDILLHLRNRIPSRGLITKRHVTAGVITHEHVLVLRKP